MNQILNINEMSDWCQENINGIASLKNSQRQIMEHTVSFNLSRLSHSAQMIHG